MTSDPICITVGSPRAHADPVRWGVAAHRVPAPNPVPIGLLGGGNQLALTVDDGTSADIGDDRGINETQLVANAAQTFQPQQIVLAHASLPPITHCLSQLRDIINSRGLRTVTLADVFS